MTTNIEQLKKELKEMQLGVKELELKVASIENIQGSQGDELEVVKRDVSGVRENIVELLRIVDIYGVHIDSLREHSEKVISSVNDLVQLVHKETVERIQKDHEQDIRNVSVGGTNLWDVVKSIVSNPIFIGTMLSALGFTIWSLK